MLNLVQIQERLKDMPMQALMQYANGMNPQVPPFIALGELNRRKQMQQAAAAEQAKQMEGAPTVKEQIEQQTGLMALQGARQRSALQQAAAQQASMPMPATNNMQSEPVQLAEGGMIDPVGQRDYRSGGITRLPIRRDMFERRAYAGGGIVAFDNGGSVFNRVDTSDTMRKKSSQYRDLLKRLFGGTDSEEMVDPADPTAMMGTRPSEGARDLASVKDERDAEEARREEIRRKADAQQQIMRDILSGKRPVPTRSNDTTLMAERRPPGLPSLAKERGPEEFPAAAIPRESGVTPTGLASLMRPDMTMDQRLEEVRRLNKLAGRDPNFMGEYEKRIGDIEARRMKERESEPMDKLTAFLSGIAQSRRGAGFGEAGAAGVSASTKLAAEQKALRDRQEMDMAQLRLSIAKEKDALAKGDLDAARSEQDKQEKLKLEIAKLQSEDEYRKGSLAMQKARFAFDKSQADETKQQEMVRKFLADFRSKNANNPKYLTKPDLLETDAMQAARNFFGVERLDRLGLGVGVPGAAGKTVDFSQLPKG